MSNPSDQENLNSVLVDKNKENGQDSSKTDGDRDSNIDETNNDAITESAKVSEPNKTLDLNNDDKQNRDETKIYVHGVSRSYSIKSLTAKFEKFGPAKDVFISGNGYAWVIMESSNAKTAIDELNGTIIDGQKVKVDDKEPEFNGGSNHGNKIFIYGVSASCPSYVLKEKFEQFGCVLEDYNSGRGYAFITMDDERNAKTAIEELNGATINGQQVKVELAKRGNGFSDRSGRDQRHNGRGGKQPRGRQHDFHSGSVAKDRRYRSIEECSTTTSSEDEDEPVKKKRNSMGSKALKSMKTSKPHRKSRNRSPLSHTSDSTGRLCDQDWAELKKLMAQRDLCFAGMEKEDEIIREATQRREAKSQTHMGIKAQIKCLREKQKKEELKHKTGNYQGSHGGRGDRWGQPDRRAGGDI